jgi:dolichyl-phosphate-mannose--protein O-mannosyl transferase
VNLETNPFLWFPISLGVVAFATVVVVVYLIRTDRSRLIWGALAVAVAVVVGLFVFAWYWAQKYLG